MATDLEMLLSEAGRSVPGPTVEVEERALRVVLALRPHARTSRRRTVVVPQSILLLLVTALALGALGPLGEDSPGKLGRSAASLLAEPAAARPVQATVVSGVTTATLVSQVVPARPRTLQLTAGPERKPSRGAPARHGRQQSRRGHPPRAPLTKRRRNARLRGPVRPRAARTICVMAAPRTILVVDDEPTIARRRRALPAREGYDGDHGRRRPLRRRRGRARPRPTSSCST